MDVEVPPGGSEEMGSRSHDPEERLARAFRRSAEEAVKGESAYAGAIRGLRDDRIVVCTPGTQNGQPVLCTSLFAADEAEHELWDDDHRVRAAYLLGIAAAAHEHLRTYHGVRCP